MNTLEQSKNEEFVKEQFIKGRILDDTKDYGRTQFVDEIYKLQQENQQLKRNCNIGNENLNFYREEYKKLEDNWNKLKEYIKQEPTLDFYNDKLPFEIIVEGILNKMQELERGVSDVED